MLSGNLDSELSALAFDAGRCLAAVDGAAVPAAILATNDMKTDEGKLNATLSSVGL